MSIPRQRISSIINNSLINYWVFSFIYCKMLYIFLYFLEFKGSTLILIQHEEEIDIRYDLISNKKKFIIGAFNHLSWRKETTTQGSSESYIFTLLPKFRNYFPKRKAGNDYGSGTYSYMSLDRKSSKNYYFLKNINFLLKILGDNNELGIGKYRLIFSFFQRVYLGFGKNETNGKFRLWIDQNLQEKSYCQSEDSVYEKGQLLDSFVQNLKVFFIK